MVKNLPASARDAGSTPGSGRSPGKGNGNPTPVFLPGKSMDRGALGAIVHGVTKSRTRLSDQTTTFTDHSVSWVSHPTWFLSHGIWGSGL